MVGSGKILTVSYGDFVCGLDGFDDPLQIMTAILDYLRYLDAIAGDTGVAPGAPDIDILTGIAMRGTDRQIEVRMQDGRILLRAVPMRAAETGVADAQDFAPDTACDAGMTETQQAQDHRVQAVTPALRDPAGNKQHPGQAASATAARVLRVRRAELERLMTHGARDRAADHPNATAPLSAEAERALQQELAAISAERGEDAAGPETGPADRIPRTEAGDDLSRIFEETDDHLQTSAASRGRNAIQHLRAALAATRAETRVSALPRRDRDGSAGRAGLPAAARLRRVRAAPARLRDVTSAGGATDPQPQDFGTYAASLTATGLPELIEAAAAYLADIEGHERFSRPMLMEKLDEIGIADVREDMLRAFDGLLDRGKLRRCADGRYAVSDSTGFRAGPRAGCGQRP